jgi:hypothetical protein
MAQFPMKEKEPPHTTRSALKQQALADIRKMLSVHAQARRRGDWAEIASSGW